jgi:hypothetical protein
MERGRMERIKHGKRDDTAIKTDPLNLWVTGKACMC